MASLLARKRVCVFDAYNRGMGTHPAVAVTVLTSETLAGGTRTLYHATCLDEPVIRQSFAR